MKNKKTFLLLVCLSVFTFLNAQMVTEDVTQVAQNSTMIAQGAESLKQAVETFKQIKKVYTQGQESYKEFVQIKGFIQTSEERLQKVGDIKDLRLNNLNAILDKVLCIKQNNYFPTQIRFLDIIAKMKAAFYNCDNRELYNKTYSGVLDNLDDRIANAGSIGSIEASNRLNELNVSLSEAQITTEATNAYDARMKLELGLKYKTISDTLMYLSEEVHLAINQDKGSNGNIALTPAERLHMMDMAVQYQIQALDYEQKSASLLKEASEADANQKAQIQRVKRDLATKQIINFQL